MKRVVLFGSLLLILLSAVSGVRAQDKIKIIGDSQLKGANPYYLTFQTTVGNKISATIGVMSAINNKDTLEVSFSGHSQEFSINPTSFRLNPYPDTQYVFITFNPLQIDTSLDSLLISVFDIDSGVSRPGVEVILTGMGVSPVPTKFYSPVRYDFGGVKDGDSACETLQINTQGARQISISDAHLTGASSSEFSIDDFSRAIQPNGDGIVRVCYTPHRADASCYLVLTWSDGDSVNKIASTFLTGYLIEGTNGIASHDASNVSMTISPNPSQGVIAVDLMNIRTGNVEITDVLGRMISSQEVQSHWTWDGTAAPRGSYFVRMSGVSSNGASFVETRRVVLN